MAIDWKTRWALAESGKLYELCAVVCGIDPSSIIHNTNHLGRRHDIRMPSSADQASREKLETTLGLARAARRGSLPVVGWENAFVDDDRVHLFTTAAFGAWARTVADALGLDVPAQWRPNSSGNSIESERQAPAGPPESERILYGMDEVSQFLQKDMNMGCLSDSTLRRWLKQHYGKEGSPKKNGKVAIPASVLASLAKSHP